MERIKTAIVGASGYTGQELLRLLLVHPQVELVAATSRQEAGKPLSAAATLRYLEDKYLGSETRVGSAAA